MKWILGIVLQWHRFKHFQQKKMLDPSHASHEKKFVRRGGSLYNIPIDFPRSSTWTSPNIHDVKD